ncbi:hypothetical protein Afe04nite_15820 [Asanoa ferruginea]|nr:hypothetical protein Afe04nite_15820 [Asanoa ferruginea]
MVTWTITNGGETAVKVNQVTAFPIAPITSVTGIAAGDTLPPAATGSLTATSTVHSYGPATETRLNLVVEGGPAAGYQAAVKLPIICGTPVRPRMTFESRCDDLLVTATMAASGYAVPLDLRTDGKSVGGFVVEPGATRSQAVTPAPARPLVVEIPGVVALTEGRWARPSSCDSYSSLGRFQLFAKANNRDVAARDQGELYAHGANRRDPDLVFEFFDVGGGDVALRAQLQGRFVTVGSDGKLRASGLRIDGDAQKFRIVTNADKTISLRSELNGKYVTAERAGLLPLVANRTAVGPWESFTRYTPETAPIGILSYARDNWVSAESAGKKPLIANRPSLGLWEFWQIEDLGNGYVAIKSLVNGKYVCAESAGTKPLIANRAAVGPWETFKRIENADDSVSYVAVNGKYVTAESAGRKPLIANRTAIGPWEKFYDKY